MVQHVNAIYEHGVLKPLGPLDLDEKQIVMLSIKEPSPAEEAIEEGASLLELMQRAGLVGCIKDAPPDLSTNPKYMEDFGKSAT
jgi:predicted DNA-binding antitoxin AbrB/MazE fold protein